MRAGPSYYDILNITPKASDDDVKRAYRQLAMAFHPDRNPHNRFAAENKLKLLNEAYSQLKNREGRIHYNRMMRTQAQNDNKSSSWLSQIGDIFWPDNKAGR